METIVWPQNNEWVRVAQDDAIELNDFFVDINKRFAFKMISQMQYATWDNGSAAYFVSLVNLLLS